MAGWTMPINKLMEEGVMDIVDCNNHVKSAINFFGKSCAVNSLQDRYCTAKSLFNLLSFNLFFKP